MYKLEGMQKRIAILQCPKCGVKEELPLEEVQENIRFRGHWWSCPNDCVWSEDELYMRHNPDDTHVYLELVDVYDEDTLFIVFDKAGGYAEFEFEDEAKECYNSRVSDDKNVDHGSLWWGRCLHMSQYLLSDKGWIPQKEVMKESLGADDNIKE